ncbi:MAG TPA: dual specificity protein phosphatase family protein, partial [Bacillota bacterium]|nr:dual specificity protein phosphatase family protein [Bacillota bacterium]
AYFCIPMLDGSAPSPVELAVGIDFIRERLRSGPVYVHCALGHGRSPTFVIGYLLACRKMASVREALAYVQSKRPGVRLRAEQLQALQELSP